MHSLSQGWSPDSRTSPPPHQPSDLFSLFSRDLGLQLEGKLGLRDTARRDWAQTQLPLLVLGYFRSW